MFPPEIIDHVLSLLQWDHATLSVCAGAHPCLSMLGERHFFRHLTLRSFDPCPSGTYRPSDLLKLIVDNPNIANHIRSLRVETHSLFWRNTKALESILSTVTQMQAISVSTTIRLVWNGLCESFCTAFTNCLRLPSLTHVDLSSIDGFPLSVLDHSSSRLKRLLLWGSFSYLPPASPPARLPLDHLDLYSCFSYEIITSWVETRSLHSLWLERCDLEESSQLLRVCANTLTTLHIDVPSAYTMVSGAPSDDLTPMPLSLFYLPHLARLTVQSSIFFTPLTHYSSLPAIMHLLHTLPSPPINLVLLIIQLNLRTTTNLDSLPDADWSPLISFPHFDVISRVELQICDQLGTPTSSVALLDKLKQDPHLMQLGKHHSFMINVVEEQDDDRLSWVQFCSDLTD